MKKLIGMAVVSMVLLSTGFVSAAEVGGVIVINPAPRGRSSTSDLRERVYMLERAVEQLQAKVFELSNGHGGAHPTPPPVAGPMVTCYIKSSFNGTFMETAPTETAARASVLKKCDEADAGLSCNEKNVKCGK